jgi:hypothetical protein
MTEHPAETLVPEEPIEFGGYQWSFRRNNDKPGEATWQVFRDDQFTPVGFVRAVYQPTETTEAGGWQLAVFDGNNKPVGESGKRDAPGTVPAVSHGRQALDWIRARMLGIA